MSKAKAEVLIPGLIVAVGLGWLMNSLEIIPGVDWAWSLGLGGTGLLWLVCGGINKGTVVIGPFLMITSVLSIARQAGHLRFEVEVPLLIVTLGALLLLARLSNLPTGLEDKKS